MKNIILASSSPRRRDILHSAGFSFNIIKPSYDENILNKSFSYELIEKNAENKALCILPSCSKNDIIISADTVVVFDNIILGKPKDYDDAFRMLNMLSGKTHKVVTSICVIDNETGKKTVKSQTSEVTFNELSKDNQNKTSN